MRTTHGRVRENEGSVLQVSTELAAPQRRLIAAPCSPSLNVGVCRDCFYVYFTHRFRAMFGRSKLVRSGDKVMIVVMT